MRSIPVESSTAPDEALRPLPGPRSSEAHLPPVAASTPSGGALGSRSGAWSDEVEKQVKAGQPALQNAGWKALFSGWLQLIAGAVDFAEYFSDENPNHQYTIPFVHQNSGTIREIQGTERRAIKKIKRKKKEEIGKNTSQYRDQIVRRYNHTEFQNFLNRLLSHPGLVKVSSGEKFKLVWRMLAMSPADLRDQNFENLLGRFAKLDDQNFTARNIKTTIQALVEEINNVKIMEDGIIRSPVDPNVSLPVRAKPLKAVAATGNEMMPEQLIDENDILAALEEIREIEEEEDSVIPASTQQTGESAVLMGGKAGISAKGGSAFGGQLLDPRVHGDDTKFRAEARSVAPTPQGDDLYLDDKELSAFSPASSRAEARLEFGMPGQESIKAGDLSSIRSKVRVSRAEARSPVQDMPPAEVRKMMVGLIMHQFKTLIDGAETSILALIRSHSIGNHDNDNKLLTNLKTNIQLARDFISEFDPILKERRIWIARYGEFNKIFSIFNTLGISEKEKLRALSPEETAYLEKLINFTALHQKLSEQLLKFETLVGDLGVFLEGRNVLTEDHDLFKRAKDLVKSVGWIVEEIKTPVAARAEVRAEFSGSALKTYRYELINMTGEELRREAIRTLRFGSLAEKDRENLTKLLRSLRAREDILYARRADGIYRGARGVDWSLPQKNWVIDILVRARRNEIILQVRSEVRGMGSWFGLGETKDIEGIPSRNDLKTILANESVYLVENVKPGDPAFLILISPTLTLPLDLIS